MRHPWARRAERLAVWSQRQPVVAAVPSPAAPDFLQPPFSAAPLVLATERAHSVWLALPESLTVVPGSRSVSHPWARRAERLAAWSQQPPIVGAVPSPAAPDFLPPPFSAAPLVLEVGRAHSIWPPFPEFLTPMPGSHLACLGALLSVVRFQPDWPHFSGPMPDSAMEALAGRCSAFRSQPAWPDLTASPAGFAATILAGRSWPAAAD